MSYHIMYGKNYKWSANELLPCLLYSIPTQAKDVENIHRYRVICNDGFSFSMQASRYHRSIQDPITKLYESVELGYPSDLDELIAPYAEEDYTINTVFNYVPVEVVDELLVKHGGVNYEAILAAAVHNH